jgi:hypothetical protein
MRESQYYVRGEEVTIIGPKPPGFTGLGHLNGDVLVLYPDGEQGCVKRSDIKKRDQQDHSGEAS